MCLFHVKLNEQLFSSNLEHRRLPNHENVERTTNSNSNRIRNDPRVVMRAIKISMQFELRPTMGCVSICASAHAANAVARTDADANAIRLPGPYLDSLCVS
jgi:hypothetical protein